MSEVEKLAEKMALAISGIWESGKAVPDPGDVEDALPYAEAILLAQEALEGAKNAMELDGVVEAVYGPEHDVPTAAAFQLSMRSILAALAALRAITGKE